ncbi:iron complex outermembrane receptor protein [Novosphingobium chloroacetimidivorans]|uniref:Iron complex outermembrane receptor protein n=1 Tax=Novosphingobium chloroacetimidivorans TaxID=1428314 RepID=A0A7W7K8N4_9SPHN|nr:TonB-dependent receptor [Novosphingobium chloroacetimidivorans]MBB4858287.1 iron complex outermembrane receptor protein [Novosphingobium chloroacetimidivorans]
MRKAIFAAAAVCASHATIAAAQVAPGQAGSATEDSGEIVVTAQKRNERLLDVPMSVAAISGEQLTTSGVFSTVNLQQTTPGIVTVNNGFGFLPIIRGIQSTGTSPGDETNVAVYLDDISLGTPISGFFDLADVERIEVLKGPQGTLYGRNATGGAIKIVTRKPSFDTQGSLALDYGFRYRELRANAYLTGKIAEGVAGSLSGAVRRGRGFIKGIAGNDGEYYGAPRNYMVRGKLLVEPTSNFSAVLAADTWKQQNDSVFISMVKGGLNPFPGPGSVANAPFRYASVTQPRADLKGYGFSLDANWGLSDEINLRSLTGYRHVEVQSQSDTDRTNLPTGSNQLSQYQNGFSQEFNLSGGADRTISWLVGAFYWHSDAGNPYFRTVSGDSPGGTIVSNFTNKMKSDAYAGFADVTANLGQFHLTGGLRYNSETKKFRWQNLVNLAAPQVDRKRTWNSTTWRAVARYDFSDDANVYASASTGFKSGVYNAYSPLGIPVDPEKVTAFEVGAKARVSGINLTAAAYAYKYTDIQVSAYSFVGTPPALQLTLSNAASAKMRGLEFNADGRLGGGFSFNAGIGWEPTAKYSRFTTSQVVAPIPGATGPVVSQVIVPFDSSGSRLVRTPKVTANLRLAYEGDLAGGRLNGSVSSSYASAKYWQPGNFSREGDFVLVNTSLGWTEPSGRFTFSVWSNNLTNTEYFTDYVPNVRGDSVKYAPKREVGVGVNYTF